MNHNYKVLSLLLVTFEAAQQAKEATDYFSESQAGFRKGRSCRDNIMILAQVIGVQAQASWETFNKIKTIQTPIQALQMRLMRAKVMLLVLPGEGVLVNK